MNFIEELRKAGLIKGNKTEAYIDSQETTTSANIATDVNGVGMVRRGDDVDPTVLKKEDETDSFSPEEKEKIILKLGEMVKALAAIGESVGCKLHELYCPNCSVHDQGTAFDQDNSDLASNDGYPVGPVGGGLAGGL